MSTMSHRSAPRANSQGSPLDPDVLATGVDTAADSAAEPTGHESAVPASPSSIGGVAIGGVAIGGVAPSGHDLEGLLEEHFGFRTFLPGQKEVLEHLLAGRSTVAVFPTGGGKSLCYQLPAVVLPGTTLVISPLIALMKDQLDALRKRGIRAARLDSSLASADVKQVLSDLGANRLRILYVAPERFRNERFRAALRDVQIALLAIDEAHCISEWGHNFRPDYLRLAQFARACGAERRLALTATATPAVLNDICQLLDVAPSCTVRTGFYRPNLTLRGVMVPDKQRIRVLIHNLAQRSRGPTIVYATHRATVEWIAEQLQGESLPARAYHAGLADEVRADVQDWFMASDDAIVVGTVAFGMGIDKPNIRYVYHYNLPKSLEHYAQEIGRGGRDGGPSTCEALVCLDDRHALEHFIYGDTPAAESVARFVQAVFRAPDGFDMALADIMHEFDMRQLVIETLLTYLELDGYLQPGRMYWSTYKFQPKLPLTAIAAKFDEPRRRFLSSLFQQARVGRSWYTVDVVGAAEKLKTSRERIVVALEYLAEWEWITLQASGGRYGYAIRSRPESLKSLAEELNRRIAERERGELARLDQVVRLLTGTQCRVSQLGVHFGELPMPQCGHCDICLRGLSSDRVPASEVSPPATFRGRERSRTIRDDLQINPPTWHELVVARKQHPRTLGPARAFARWACGIHSPRLTHDRLHQHPLFGALKHVPFHDVLSKLETNGL